MSSDLLGLLGNLENVDSEGCPVPFVGERLHPYTGGYLAGRNCVANPLIPGGNGSRCCTPCPLSDYMYSDNFKSQTDAAAWVNVVGFILCAFLLLSFAVLPAAATRRAYLNIVLVVGILLMELSYLIPLAVQPDRCYDPVTPNGQSSDMTCAWSGSFATFGGMFLVTWILIRALFMHLQICWSVTPGRLSYIVANIVALSVTISLVTATLVHAGVSYRYGAYCHINVGSISTYWGWLLGMAAVAFLLQVATFGYCIRIYLSSAWQQRNDPSTRSASVIGSSKTRTARASARRVREVLVLQWRSLAIVAIAIFTIAFVCTVFIVYDNNNTLAGLQNVDDRLIPWVICIIQTQDKTKCLAQASKINVDQDLAVATLFIIGIIGIEAFILLSRPEMFLAWWELLRRAGKTRRSGSTTSELLMRTIPKNYQQQPERMSGSLDKAVDYDGIPSGFRGEAESESKQYPLSSNPIDAPVPMRSVRVGRQRAFQPV